MCEGQWKLRFAKFAFHSLHGDTQTIPILLHVQLGLHPLAQTVHMHELYRTRTLAHFHQRVVHAEEVHQTKPAAFGTFNDGSSVGLAYVLYVVFRRQTVFDYQVEFLVAFDDAAQRKCFYGIRSPQLVLIMDFDFLDEEFDPPQFNDVPLGQHLAVGFTRRECFDVNPRRILGVWVAYAVQQFILVYELVVFL